MRRFLDAEDFDTGAAACQFATLCQRDYARSARTVWRIHDDGQPPPYVNVFDWGGHFFRVPNLRVWFAQQGNEAPIGIGAFLDYAGDQFPEQAEIQRRLVELLKAPGCYLVRE